jgi:transcriptional regulator with PAS, ATPase and Fis domain
VTTDEHIHQMLQEQDEKYRVASAKKKKKKKAAVQPGQKIVSTTKPIKQKDAMLKKVERKSSVAEISTKKKESTAIRKISSDPKIPAKDIPLKPPRQEENLAPKKAILTIQ